ncbi:MAG: DUF4184 family protein [Candidatus Thorarchaeota archaeon]|nr:MAG: DUF4184 family protein [Candidatus Thorarchaeota archaeon]
MPVTPLHYPFAFLISKSDKRLSLPALVVGSLMPDIEVPLMWIFFSSLPDHLFLHSFIGAATVGTVLTLVVTRFLYAPLISAIFGVDRTELDEVCKITPWLIASSFIGVMSHLILDFPIHWYNPILWPWVNPFDVIGTLVLFFMPAYGIWNAYLFARLLVNIAMVIIWIVILMKLYSKGNLWSRHWVGRSSSD